MTYLNLQAELMEFTQLRLEHKAAIEDYVAEFTIAGEARIHGYFGESNWDHAETVMNL